MLGGRTAEKLELASVSSGADDDISQATGLARSMVTRWGMDAEVGPIDLRDSDEHPFLGREIAKPRKHSEASAQAVDAAVARLLQNAEARANETMSGHHRQLKKLVTALEERETLHREDIVALLGTPPGQSRGLNAVHFHK
jgi:cell division protease FtsH